MKRFLIILYCAYARSKEDNGDAKILEYKFERQVGGPYDYRFVTSQGFKREESAELLHEGTKFETIFLRGSYQYQGADGKTYTIKYRADENGFHPEGEHIQVPPFVPWPSRIAVKYGKKQSEPKATLKKSNGLKPTSFNSVEFLMTQIPPKFSNRYQTHLKSPSMIISTPRPNVHSVTIINPNEKTEQGSPVRIPERFKIFSFKTNKKNRPASSLKPPIREDFDNSPTTKKYKFNNLKTVATSKTPDISDITKLYIPTSPVPPEMKGDAIEISAPLRKNF